MLFTVVKKNTYQDSINLMLLTNRINTLEGVKQSQIMMATDANKDIYRNAGLLTAEAEAQRLAICVSLWRQTARISLTRY